jgi:hypothetical protein
MTNIGSFDIMLAYIALSFSLLIIVCAEEFQTCHELTSVNRSSAVFRHIVKGTFKVGPLQKEFSGF